jgi:HK97 family phage major capsid protein
VIKMTNEELQAMIKEMAVEQVKDLGGSLNEALMKEIDLRIKEAVKVEVEKKPDVTTDDKKAGFVNFADFAQCVAQAEVNPRNTDKRLSVWMEKAAGDGMSEGVDSEGGFLIPPDFRGELLKLATEKSNLMSRCTVIPMETNAIPLPYIKDTDRSGGYIYGAIQMYWTAEEGQKTASKPKFGRVSLSLNTLAGLCYTTNEILEDSPVSLEPLLTEAFTDAMGWTMDNALLNATGAGQPLGILNAPCLISVAKETGQAANTILYENIVKMESRLLPQSEGKAIYLANKDTFPQLASMSIAVGTGGIPVFLPANGASGKPYNTLMGRQLIFTEHCQTVGTKGDIYLADFSQMLLGQKKGRGITADTSIHLKFDYNQTAFRFTFRVDAQPWLPSDVKPRYGTNTLSPFVAIELRN